MNTICQGFSLFSALLHYFVLTKLATTSISVKCVKEKGWLSLPNCPVKVNGQSCRGKIGLIYVPVLSEIRSTRYINISQFYFSSRKCTLKRSITFQSARSVNVIHYAPIFLCRNLEKIIELANM